jgi:hypothetical protein
MYTGLVISTFPALFYMGELLYSSHQKHTSNNFYLSDSMTIPKDDTDLRRARTLLSQFADLIHHLLRASLEPCWRRARVWDCRGSDTLALAVKTTHLELTIVATVDVYVSKKRKGGKVENGAKREVYLVESLRSKVCFLVMIGCGSGDSVSLEDSLN